MAGFGNPAPVEGVRRPGDGRGRMHLGNSGPYRSVCLERLSASGLGSNAALPGLGKLLLTALVPQHSGSQSSSGITPPFSLLFNLLFF